MSYLGTLQGIETLIPLETLRKECPEAGIPEFVHCDAGEFMMGGVKFDSEMPVHKVRISAPFWNLCQSSMLLPAPGHTPS